MRAIAVTFVCGRKSQACSAAFDKPWHLVCDPSTSNWLRNPREKAWIRVTIFKNKWFKSLKVMMWNVFLCITKTLLLISDHVPVSHDKTFDRASGSKSGYLPLKPLYEYDRGNLTKGGHSSTYVVPEYRIFILFRLIILKFWYGQYLFWSNFLGLKRWQKHVFSAHAKSNLCWREPYKTIIRVREGLPHNNYSKTRLRYARLRYEPV